MSGLKKLAFALLLTSASWAAEAQRPVKFVLASRMVVLDPSPSAHLRTDQPLVDLFTSKFEAAFPGQVKHLNLDSPDGMISPNEKVIVIVPTITAARLADELKVGSIHDFEAMVVGDISAIDPWTNANLFSGTRMASATFELGQSALGRLDESARNAFWAAANLWLDRTIEQLKTNLTPFSLEGATLAPPERVKKFKGGIWPFGSEKGVKGGMTLNGGGGRFARVTAAFPKFSLLEDAADPSRLMAPGEQYSITLVDKPTERPEPSVELVWLGQRLKTPEGMANVTPLDNDALLGLFDNYLSKGGGLKILPPPIENPEAHKQLLAIAQEISNRSKLVQGNFMAFERATLVQRAAERPDFILEVGAISSYHGARRAADGSVSHLYRITYAASIRSRTGAEDAPVYPVQTIFKNPEEYALVSAAGVREIDEADAFFTLSRNGIINLAKRVREGMPANQPGASVTKDGVVLSGGSIDWKGALPPPFTPLTWLRPGGEVKGPDGSSLGALYQPQPPRQGYMNPTTASAEKLEPGDVLRYTATGAAARPIVSMRLGDLGSALSWIPQTPWTLRQAAKLFGIGADVVVVPEEQGTGTQIGVQRTISVNISALSLNPQPAAAYFSGQWRCQILPVGSAEPILKFGIQNDSSVAIPANALSPLDTDAWGLQYTVESLKKLIESGGNKGMKQVLTGGS